MFESINELIAFGDHYLKRKSEIENKIKASKETQHLEFMGKYQTLPIVEVRIELPVYRLNNGRTKSFQKEYLATHPNVEKDIFTRDHDSIEVQKVQHEILRALADEEDLLRSFRQGDLQQTEPLISTNTGVIVNGNRRLCVWRELYYTDIKKYKYFETIKLAILPDCDERAIRDLEKRLQVQNTMKAEYHWHTIAFMASEEIDQGVSLKTVADSFGDSPKNIKLIVDCRQYAEIYLQSIGKPEQWSLVDKDMFAFEQMVKGRKKLDGSGKKELFETLAFEFIKSSKNEGRLYELIPSIAENLDSIKRSFEEKLNVPDNELIPDEILLLSGDDDTVLETSGLIAKKIKEIDNQDFIRKTTISVIETQKQLQKEQDKENFLLNQLTKAATLLTELVVILSEINSVNTKGIKMQISKIKEKISVIENWLDIKHGNKN